MADHPKTVDDYLAGVQSETARATLSWLRGIIRNEAPDAEEVISYGIPTYMQGGYLISFAAFKKHCSLFPGHTMAEFEEELKSYKTAKGTVQFPHDKPPPEPLIRAIVAARLTENLAGGATRSGPIDASPPG